MLQSVKKGIAIIPIVFVLATGCQKQAMVQPQPVVCPQDTELCPGGSYISRVAPDCDFAACPTPPPIPEKQESGIMGVIALGPMCPVQTTTNPSCADKPYQTEMIVKTSDGSREVTRFKSTMLGVFKVALSPGTYMLVPENTTTYPSTPPQVVAVRDGQFTMVTIDFDSGMR